MAPRLSHVPPPAVRNFYENSFKQCTAIQQRQVGLIVGAAVADAAARPLDGCSRARLDALAQSLREQAQGDDDDDKKKAATTATDDVASTLAFADVPDDDDDDDDADAEAADVGRAMPLSSSPLPARMLSCHSFSYLLYYELLRTMSAARGDFTVDAVAPRWVALAAAVPPAVYAAQHGALLHTAAVLLPLPCIYPYASDATLHCYAQPFIDFVSMPPASSSSSSSSSTAAEAAEQVNESKNDDASRDEVACYTACVQSALLRFLQRCPDAVRNTALTASSPRCAAVFPADMHELVARYTQAQQHNNNNKKAVPLLSSSQQQQRAGVAAAATMTTTSRAPHWSRRDIAADAAVVRESMHIARHARTYTSGVLQALRSGVVRRSSSSGGAAGTLCQRAMLVGAMLGARYGVRCIPSEWLSATPDHAAVATMALEVAQWSWNPPHH